MREGRKNLGTIHYLQRSWRGGETGWMIEFF